MVSGLISWSWIPVEVLFPGEEHYSSSQHSPLAHVFYLDLRTSELSSFCVKSPLIASFVGVVIGSRDDKISWLYSL